MALKATVCKCSLQISDLDRHYYDSVNLTLAQHPSETDLRVMVRIAVYALQAHADLQFTRGISTDDEPDLWQKDLTGVIENWIELGQPDERRLRKACGRAKQVCLYTYQSRAAQVWWQQNEATLAKLDNLRVWHFDHDEAEALAALYDRNMDLQALIQDGEIALSSAHRSVTLKPRIAK